MRLFLWLLLVIALGAEAAPRRAHPPRQKPARPSPSAPAPYARPAPAPSREGEGRVTQVTAARAYLDRGQDAGLTAGVSLQLRRRGRPAGSCKLEWVAPHHATCTGAGASVGDSFQVSKPTQAARPAALPPQIPQAELSRRAASLAAAPFPKVEFGQGARGGPRVRLGVETELAHDAWAAVTAATGPFQEERLDLALRGTEVGAGLRLFLDATALRWSRRPEGFRFPSASATQLYVHQAELSLREPGRAFTLGAGRIWPWAAPGIGVVDGVQAGWRSARGDLEAGVVGGLVPNAVTLAPELRRPVVGGYIANTWTFDGPLRWLRQESRVSLASTPAEGWRLEVEGLVRGWLGRWADFSAGVRVGLGQASAPALLDAARVDLGLHPLPQVRFSLGARYSGSGPSEVLEPGGLTTPDRWLHADASGSWDVTSWLSVGASGFHARDLGTRMWRTFGGPEVSFPTALGRLGGISLGYQHEAGAALGRTAYLQAILAPFERLRVFARGSYFDDAGPLAGTVASGTELGAFTSVEYRFTDWLALRASALGRFGLTPGEREEGTAGPRPVGVTASGGLGGRF